MGKSKHLFKDHDFCFDMTLYFYRGVRPKIELENQMEKVWVLEMILNVEVN